MKMRFLKMTLLLCCLLLTAPTHRLLAARMPFGFGHRVDVPLKFLVGIGAIIVGGITFLNYGCYSGEELTKLDELSKAWAHSLWKEAQKADPNLSGDLAVNMSATAYGAYPVPLFFSWCKIRVSSNLPPAFAEKLAAFVDEYLKEQAFTAKWRRFFSENYEAFIRLKDQVGVTML